MNNKTLEDRVAELAPTKKPKPFPCAVLVRSRTRYPGETYEDYRLSMGILNKVQKLITRYGSQHTLWYDADTGAIRGL